MFPLFSIELFLIGLSAVVGPSFEMMTLCCAVAAAIGHQIAKTISYYAGVGALEHGKIKAKLDKHPRVASIAGTRRRT